MGITLFSTLFSLLIYKQEWVDNKYGMFSSYGGFTYQYLTLFLIAGNILLYFLIFPIAWIQGGIYNAICFSSASILPSIFMYLKLDVYNDKSRELIIKNNEILENEEVIGYFPLCYFLLGVYGCTHLIGLSSLRVLECILKNSNNLIYYIFCFLISVVIMSFILSPDVANRILPFELKKQSGMKNFIIISIILFAFVALLLI